MTDQSGRTPSQNSGGLNSLLASARKGDDVPGAVRKGEQSAPAPEPHPAGLTSGRVSSLEPGCCKGCHASSNHCSTHCTAKTAPGTPSNEEEKLMCNDCDRNSTDTETIYCDDCYAAQFDGLDD